MSVTVPEVAAEFSTVQMTVPLVVEHPRTVNVIHPGTSQWGDHSSRTMSTKRSRRLVEGFEFGVGAKSGSASRLAATATLATLSTMAGSLPSPAT
jgi:hypothetical protein